MLYDNILFVNLLGQFYTLEPNEYYKEKIIQTVEFINKSFKNKENLLGSAYDADSEGVEGKYYVWDDKELRNVLRRMIMNFLQNIMMFLKMVIGKVKIF